jgi:nicotinamidase-related amidase
VQPLPQNAALIVIDVQQGFDDPAFGPRNNPQAEENIARLPSKSNPPRRCSVVARPRHPGLSPNSSNPKCNRHDLQGCTNKLIEGSEASSAIR